MSLPPRSGTADNLSCIRCRRPFQPTTKDQVLCPNCLKIEDEAALAKLNSYQRLYPEAQVGRIVQDTGVNLQTIIRLTQAGRFKLNADKPSLSSCSRCGKPVASGLMCEDCRRKLHSELSAAQNPAPGSPAGNRPGQTTPSSGFHTRPRR